MQFIGKIILPSILITGSLYLIVIELLAYPRLKKYGHPEGNLKIRMARRISGSILVIISACMIYWGLYSFHRPSIGHFHKQALHWAIVMGIVFIIVILALWDAIEGIKYLEKLASRISKEDLDAVQENIKAFEAREKKG